MAIIIDLGVVDKTAAKKIEDVAKSLEKLDDSLGGAADQMERLSKAGGKAGGTMRAAARGPKAPPRIKFTKGPAQRLLELERQEGLLGTITDPVQRAAVAQDIQRSKFLQQRSINLQNRRNQDPSALTRPGLLELFGTLNDRLGGLGGSPGRAISQILNMISGGRSNVTGGTNIATGGSSGGDGGLAAGAAGGAGGAAVRKIIGGKVSIVPPPVIGGAAGGAAGGISALAAIALPAAVALVALTTAFVAAKAVFLSFITQGRTAGRGAARTGGNVEAFQALRGVADFLGVDATTLANTLGGGGGGLRGAAIQGLGGSALPNFARPGLSNAQNALNVIRGLTDPGRSNANARRLAQQAGPDFEQALELRNLTPQRLAALLKVFEQMASPEQVSASAAFSASMTELATAFERLKSSVAVVTAITFITKHLEILANVLDFIGRVIRNIVNSIPGFNIGGGKTISEMAEENIRSNTRELRINSQRLAQNTETLGGGRRAQGALPPGMINDIIFNNGAPGAVGLGLL